ncbi:TPA: manganese efflux pump MntP family protein [Morganella morganii]
MSFYATLVLALALSMDAFAVAVCKGATLHKPPLREALRTGFIFGVIEALTPLIGWAIGIYASRYVMEWDHWIAFSLLFILGARMIYNSVTAGDDCCARHEKPQRHSALHLATTGMILGRYIGPMLGKRAEIVGGIVLILIGFTILYEHIG